MQAQYVVTIMTGSTSFSSTICVGVHVLPASSSTYLTLANHFQLPRIK